MDMYIDMLRPILLDSLAVSGTNKWWCPGREFQGLKTALQEPMSDIRLALSAIQYTINSCDAKEMTARAAKIKFQYNYDNIAVFSCVL